MPNVILITLDTLRADHLGCYGYDRPTSPRIDAFAETATLYRRGYATSPWTVPTHGSLFTGKFPYEHGAHSFKVDRPVMNVNRLPLEHLTLAEALKSEGYQ
ncbi:MAG: sulfatase-like hydrolase/transferase, partial [Planctomycetota bacterium]|nr:sulfatase-like hydrolase/transferase [Planctomycetota bacterium]